MHSDVPETLLLEERVGRALTERGLTVATAESCTGGLLSHRLTNVPGSSAYVLGGIVAYADQVKMRLLDVSPATIEKQGAVSEATALEMARGARRQFGADLALATTGIAGPSGGTPQKPVGLVYIALAAACGEWCERYVWSGDRLENKEQSADAALRLLLRHLAEGK